MRPKVAKIISYAFHPLLIPVYSVLLYYTIGLFRYMNPRFLILGILCTIFFSVLIPLLSFLWLSEKGYISSVNIPKKEDRVVPYLICAASLTACSLIMASKHIFPFVYGTLAGGAIVLIICALINNWWKISVHSAAMGCWLGCVLNVWAIGPMSHYFLNNNNAIVISAVILVSGLVTSARMASEQNTPAQVAVGFAIGLAIGYPFLFLFFPGQ